jgi:KAP family P-loop domain
LSTVAHVTWAFIILLADREDRSGLAQLLSEVTEPGTVERSIWLAGPRGGKNFFENAQQARAWTHENVPEGARRVYLLMDEPGLGEVVDQQQNDLFYVGVTSDDKLQAYANMDRVTAFVAEGTLDFVPRIMLDWNGTETAHGALFDKGKAVGMLKLTDAQLTPEQTEEYGGASAPASDNLKRAVLRYLPRYAVLPSTSVVSDLWTIDDRLGYRPFADAIAVFLRHEDTRAPLTVGIRAPWGAGKTSLMRMIRDSLDPSVDGERSHVRLKGADRTPEDGTRVGTVLRLIRRRSEQALSADVDGNNRVTVWFNPWMYQTGEQIWAGLANEIIKQVTDRMTPGQREMFWLKINLRRVGREAVRRVVYRTLLRHLILVALLLAAFGIAAGALALASAGRVLSGAVLGAGGVVAVMAGCLQYFRLRLENARDVLGNLVRWRDPMQPEQDGTSDALVTVADPSYAARAGFLQFVHSDVRAVLDLVATEKRPLVVFIDDLDRCSPRVVAQVIEAVNAFLAGEFPNCLFVMAMEPRATVASIQVAYSQLFRGLKSPAEDGPSLGWRFLDKLVQLPLQLPSAGTQKVLHDYLSSLGQPVVAGSTGESDSGSQGGDETTSEGSEGALSELGLPTSPGAEPAGGRSQAELKARLARADTLDEICQIAEALRGDRVASDEEVVQAATEVFDSRFRPTNPEVNAVVSSELSVLPVVNGREVKRFVNLFRFYAVIGVRRRLQGYESATIGEAATLATLASRWPDIVGVAIDPEALTALRNSSLARGKAKGSDPRFGHIDQRRLLAISEYLQDHELSPGALSLLVG